MPLLLLHQVASKHLSVPSSSAQNKHLQIYTDQFFSHRFFINVHIFCLQSWSCSVGNPVSLNLSAFWQTSSLCHHLLPKHIFPHLRFYITITFVNSVRRQTFSQRFYYGSFIHKFPGLLLYLVYILKNLSKFIYNPSLNGNSPLLSRSAIALPSTGNDVLSLYRPL